MSSKVEWALAETDDLVPWIGDEASEYVDELQQIIDRVSAYMERYTGRKLVARTYNYATDSENALGDGSGQTYFFTKQWPVNSITTLIIGDTTITAAPDWDEDGYKLYKRQGKIYYENGFDKYRHNIKLVYNAGYETTTPEYAELNMVCCAMVTYIWNQRENLGFKQEFLGRYRYARGDFQNTDKWLFQALDKYKRGVFSR